MLQAIRSKAGSWVVKLLFVVLIGTFAIWGIGDIVTRRPTDTTVAQVGDVAIRAAEVQVAVQRDLERYRGLFGNALDINQAKAFGVIDGTVDRLVNEALQAQEAQRLGVAVGDDTVAKWIVNDPQFQGRTGTFDRLAYNATLAQNRLTDAQYETRIREILKRGFVIEAVASGLVPPAPAIALLQRARAEERSGVAVFLPFSAAGDIPGPSDQDLQAFHEKRPDLFRVPEYRRLTVAVLGFDDVGDRIEVTPEAVREAYESHLNDFSTPERRRMRQMVLVDEAKAKEAETALAAGESFGDVATRVAGMDEAATDLGLVLREELPAELRDPAFAAASGQATAPLKTAFGWHILLTEAIQPATVRGFEEVRADILRDLRREKAADEIFRTGNEIEDALAGGASLDEAIRRFGMRKTVVDETDPSGFTSARTRAQIPEPAREILAASFEATEGAPPRLREAKDGSYYAVRVEEVRPARVRPLAEARDDAERLWRDDRQRSLVEERARTLAAAAGPGGKTLADAAGESGLESLPWGPLKRQETGEGKLPAAVLGRVFGAEPGGAPVVVPDGQGVWVAQVRTAARPAAPEPAATAEVTRQVEAELREDAVTAWASGLRKRFPVEVRRAEIDRLF